MDADRERLNTEYLKSVIHSIGDMVRVITNEGRVAFTNRAYDDFLSGGMSTEGQRCYEVFGQDTDCDPCVAREVIATGTVRQITRRHNGKILSVTSTPLRSPEGEIVGAVEVLRDMTLDYNVKQSLMTQNAKMQRDLQLARSLQQALMKNVMPVVEGFELHAGFFPCEAVGGDIFNCTRFGNKLVMYVADVSGHGVMPSMIAVFFSRAVQTACSLGMLLPSDIFRYVQGEFLELGLSDSMYITAFVVVLDITNGKFAYSNAGLSVVPVLYDGQIHELYMSSPPISRWFEKPAFEDGYSELTDGARMLIYSDGIRDVQSDDKVRDKLYDFFMQKDFACDEFVGNVKRELHTRPEDDLTILICNHVGKAV